MRLLLAVALASCGGARETPRVVEAPPTLSVPSELSPALMPLAWLRGTWQARGAPNTEYWVAAGGALYGVSLHDGGGFEVMIVDDAGGPGKADGIVRFYAMPEGNPPTEFRAEPLAERSVVFANPAHDFPQTIRYSIDGSHVLRAELGPAGRVPPFVFDFEQSSMREPDLDRADRVFAADTAARGVEGWLATFEPTGWMLRKDAKVTGAAIGELMKPLLDAGTLVWEPLASGVRGNLGFTVGTATYTPKRAEDSWRSSYVTIWAKQPDGSWKVRFDTGRPVNE